MVMAARLHWRCPSCGAEAHTGTEPAQPPRCFECPHDPYRPEPFEPLEMEPMTTAGDADRAPAADWLWDGEPMKWDDETGRYEPKPD
jgi:hypothetical protein